ncbi:Glycerate-2- kinase [Salmonella enterica subsp. enterica]|uniref:Glycerate-2- kinase n=1 Tax=Salmonella enterica I TaxID=59201 RepID=A0A379WKY2_SALET|nr:Glycerate-2- kinase [Salmonella enterica subsp. enterica]
MMQALGAKLRDANGADIGYGGGSLHCLSDIDISELDPRLKLCAIRVACDVSNPLIGDNGASRIFGPQKGATEENIVELDRNLAHYADIIKKSLNVDVKAAPGAGAAGRYGGGVNGFSRCGITQRDRNCHGGTEPGGAYPRLYAGGDGEKGGLIAKVFAVKCRLASRMWRKNIISQ